MQLAVSTCMFIHSCLVGTQMDTTGATSEADTGIWKKNAAALTVKVPTDDPLTLTFKERCFINIPDDLKNLLQNACAAP